jgi:hypothetical protein
MQSEKLKIEFLNRKNKLTQSLINFNDDQLASVVECEKILKDISDLQQLISAAVFLNAQSLEKTQDEFNQQVPEQIISVTETITEKTETTIVEDIKVEAIEIVEKTETIEIKVAEEPIKENKPIQEEIVVDVKQTTITTTSVSSVNAETLIPKSNKPIKKMEIGINDKFRFINELFGQSQLEYSTAIEQLNLCDNLEESENYLNNIKELYKWKNDSPLLKTLFALNQKRFS